jgi:hypothetical protein
MLHLYLTAIFSEIFCNLIGTAVALIDAGRITLHSAKDIVASINGYKVVA